MKHLKQTLNTADDSFTYTVSGETEPSYRVDSNGYLHDMKRDKNIGEFRLGNGTWSLFIGNILYMTGPDRMLFGLPEFELKSLTALVNQ